MSDEIIFRIPLKAVTFQSQRYGKGFVYKTEYQKNFLKAVGLILSANNRACLNFSSKFDPKKHVLVGQWFFFYENFFTKKEKTISSAVPDLENGKKMVQDAIFKGMGLNDKDIVHSEDIKWLGKDSIIFSLKILKRDEFQTIIENKVKNILI